MNQESRKGTKGIIQSIDRIKYIFVATGDFIQLLDYLPVYFLYAHTKLISYFDRETGFKRFFQEFWHANSNKNKL